MSRSLPGGKVGQGVTGEAGESASQARAPQKEKEPPTLLTLGEQRERTPAQGGTLNGAPR